MIDEALASPRGMSDGAVGFLDFLKIIPQTLDVVGKNVIPISAAFGEKHALAYTEQQNQLKAMDLQAKLYAAQATLTEASGKSFSESIKAAAPWIAFGAGGIGLSVALVKAVQAKKKVPA